MASQGRGSGRSYFGEVSDRLRRFLGLDGAWPVEIGPQVVPVIIAGDATTGGLSPFVGRRFGIGRNATAGAVGNGMVVQATTDRGIIIDQLIMGTSLAGSFQLRYGNNASLFAGPTDTSIIIDNASPQGAERAGVAQGIIPTPAGTIVHEAVNVTQGNYTWDFGAAGRGIYLPQFAYLWFGITAGAPNLSLGCFGRIPQTL